MGYFWTYDHVNAADYGVPQTRRRLILRASRGLLPHLPPPVPWVGWYAAIEDLLPTLPESKLAPWQLARLPQELRGSVLVAGLLNTDCTRLTARDGDEPSFTVTTSHNQKDVRAWTPARVVAMTPRTLARFQSLPDWYQLPDKRTLAAKVIGNMVPPLLMQRVAEGILA
jgi:DNA (cytosine-5)-methyltransferase 1